MWNCSPWALLPPVYSLFTAAGLWVVYFVAVNNEQIVPLSSQGSSVNESRYLPYISMAGNFPPASCIFSEVMNLAAFMGLIIAVLRYLQLKHTTVKPWLNISSLVVFAISCFGMTLVGNVQLSNGMLIHELGALLTFGLGTIFCWVQSYITLKVNLRNEGRKAGIIRFLFSGAATVSMFIRVHPMIDDLQGARCQWALVMFFLAFIGTFAIEFRHSRFEMLSPAILGGLQNISRTIESRAYMEGLNIHTHIVSNSNFSETSASMPVLKVVLTQANKLGV